MPAPLAYKGYKTGTSMTLRFSTILRLVFAHLHTIPTITIRFFFLFETTKDLAGPVMDVLASTTDVDDDYSTTRAFVHGRLAR